MPWSLILVLAMVIVSPSPTYGMPVCSAASALVQMKTASNAA